MSLTAWSPIDSSSYQAHTLHALDRAWVETNCYIDVWIEVLHALKLEPLACLSMVFALDCEGDQWTFYKPPHEDLFTLYGIEVQELNVWRSLLDNASAQLRRGRLVLSEADSFYLPDTIGTDYRQHHVKTTIAIHEIDLPQQRLGYFHNSAYHHLQGEDFIETFRIGKDYDPTFMPLFAEFVRFDRMQQHEPPRLAERSLLLLRKHLARRPQQNPLTAYQTIFLTEVERLKTLDLAAYHAYAFANLRQLGSAFCLGAAYLHWLQAHSGVDFSAATHEFAAISDVSKTLLLKTARAVTSTKHIDLRPLLEQLAQHWQVGMDALDHSLYTEQRADG